MLRSFSIYGQSNLKGIWNAGKDDTKIEISEAKGLLTGRIMSSGNPKAEIRKSLNFIGNIVFKISKQEIYIKKKK